MQPLISIIIPAWNEGDRIKETLQAVRAGLPDMHHIELIVVDDGSIDDTYRQAEPWATSVIRHLHNRGKGAALESGWRAAKGAILLFLDADLGESAYYARKLLSPLEANTADMCIAKLPNAVRKGGFGLVKGLASKGIYKLSGYLPSAPLSGQRAVRRDVLERIGGLSKGYGIEVGLTIDVARSGFRIVEVEVPFRHRETGRDWSGFYHRGKQFLQVGMTLLKKWRNPVC